MDNFISKGERITVTGPSGGLSAGDPYVVGSIPCVASVDIAESATGSAMTKGVFDLAVKGETTTDAAVSIGDAIYYDSGVLNKDSANGTLFGYALGAVASGATTTIEVFVK